MRRITVAWLFGSIFFTAIAGAPVTLFAAAMGATPFTFGLLAAMPFLASLLSLPAGMLIDRFGHRKLIFFLAIYPQRFLWAVVGLAPMWLAGYFGGTFAPSAVALWTFMGLLLLMWCGTAVAGPAWTSWMADIIPPRRRGAYFARRRQWGIVTAVPTALIVGLLLDRVTDPADPSAVLPWIAGIFIVAAVVGVIDIALFHAVPDVPQPPRVPEPLFASMRRPLGDRQFLYFAGYVGTLMFAVAPMGQFVTLYFIQRLQMDNTQVQLILLAVPLAAQLLVLGLWGKVADRFGKKPVLSIASLGMVPVGLGWVLMNEELVWLGYLLSATGAALWVGIEVANFNMLLEFGGAGGRGGRAGSSYIAVNGVIINLSGVAGGLAFGQIASSLDGWSWQTGLPLVATVGPFEVLFAVSAVLRLLAVVVFLPHVKEPAARPTREAVRFMYANIYSNVFSAALQPLRLLRPAMRRERRTQARLRRRADAAAGRRRPAAAKRPD